jgi:hypothetical protein
MLTATADESVSSRSTGVAQAIESDPNVMTNYQWAEPAADMLTCAEHEPQSPHSLWLRADEADFTGSAPRGGSESEPSSRMNSVSLLGADGPILGRSVSRDGVAVGR